MRKRLIFASKRSNVFTDTFMIVLTIFIFAIASYNGIMVFKELNDDIQGDDSMSTEAKLASGGLYNDYGAVMDGGFLTILILLWILVIVASFLIDAHPIFFIVSVLLLFFILFIGAVLSNYYVAFIEQDEYSSFSSTFTYTNFVMQNIVWFIIAIGASVTIVLYGKGALLSG